MITRKGGRAHIRQLLGGEEGVRQKVTRSDIEAHSTLLQAEEKRARNPVLKCPSKLLEPAIGQFAG